MCKLFVNNVLKLFLILFLSILSFCSNQTNNKDNGQEELMPISKVIEKHSENIMLIKGVVGVYEGRTEDNLPCIKIMVEKITAELQNKLPKKLEGYPVIIEETGVIEPM